MTTAYKTKFHRDGTVTLWNVFTQAWQRTDHPGDDVLASLDAGECERVMRHCGIATMTEQQREELIAAVEAANLCCPEQVCDAVLAVAESEGIEAARAELSKAVANDAAESRAMGSE